MQSRSFSDGVSFGCQCMMSSVSPLVMLADGRSQDYRLGKTPRNAEQDSMEDGRKAPEETCNDPLESATQLEAVLNELQARIRATVRREMTAICEQTLSSCSVECTAKLQQAEDRCHHSLQKEVASRSETCDRLCNLIAEEANERKAGVDRLCEQVGAMSTIVDKAHHCLQGAIDLFAPGDNAAFNESRFQALQRKMEEAEGRADKLQLTLYNLELMCGDAMHARLKGLESELAVLVSMVGTLRDQHHQVVKPIMGVENLDTDATPFHGGYFFPHFMQAYPQGIAKPQRNLSLSVSHPPPQQLIASQSGVDSVKFAAKVIPPDRKSCGSVAPRSPAGAPNS
eukprot:1263703-Amphidinium_carterae.1